MSLLSVLEDIQKKSGLTMYALGKKLKLKSTSHVWAYKKGLKKPSIATCFKIIAFAKEIGIKNITLDKLRGDG